MNEFLPINPSSYWTYRHQGARKTIKNWSKTTSHWYSSTEASEVCLAILFYRQTKPFGSNRHCDGLDSAPNSLKVNYRLRWKKRQIWCAIKRWLSVCVHHKSIKVWNNEILPQPQAAIWAHWDFFCGWVGGWVRGEEGWKKKKHSSVFCLGLNKLEEKAIL